MELRAVTEASTGTEANSASSDSALTPARLLQLYRAMVRLRTLDDRMMILQRQGRIGFYGACRGQEAAALGSAFALEASDWIFPALRESGAMLMRGFPLVPYIAQLFGNSADLTKGRQMPSHPAARSVNQVSWGSCIGTQLPHAVGAAYAARLQGKADVMLAYLGDGATSTSDFHSAMNFAAVWRAPVVFLCQNNHWSISVPTQSQTAARTLALKAKGYGMPGLKIDGNDAVAVYRATRAAVDRARRGEGPTFIEAETYRIGAHSSSDDPTRYRDQREVDAWVNRDPIAKLRTVLDAEAGWNDTQDERLREELLAEVNEALAAAEGSRDLELATLFDDVYAHLPWHLAEQRREAISAPS